METKVQVKQVNTQNKESKIVVLGNVSELTLGKQGGGLESNNRPYRAW